jgi:hypothetical protein
MLTLSLLFTAADGGEVFAFGLVRTPDAGWVGLWAWALIARCGRYRPGSVRGLGRGQSRGSPRTYASRHAQPDYLHRRWLQPKLRDRSRRKGLLLRGQWPVAGPQQSLQELYVAYFSRYSQAPRNTPSTTVILTCWPVFFRTQQRTKSETWW